MSSRGRLLFDRSGGTARKVYALELVLFDEVGGDGGLASAESCRELVFRWARLKVKWVACLRTAQ
jgi:hypothetical protein